MGTWGTVAEREAYLIVNRDGTFGGHDGCNGFGGRWESDEATGTIEFVDAAMSLVMCEGMETWLTRGRYAAPAGDRMQILDEEYRVIGTLPRTAG